MGGFDYRPENWRAENSETGDAQNALRNVTQQLQNLQQNLLSSMQSEVARLNEEKNRLTDEIRQLQEEKDNLQQVRHITEQQVLMRQLGQVLANHISSQLQSELENLASIAVGSASHSENQASKQTPIDANSVVPTEEIERNVERMLGNLDDTLTITLNSLQQELSNYQSNLSQQLSRMRNQQQVGETLLAQLVSRLRTQLETPVVAPLQTTSSWEGPVNSQFQEISSPLKDTFESEQAEGVFSRELETTPIVTPTVEAHNDELEVNDPPLSEDSIEPESSYTESEKKQQISPVPNILRPWRFRRNDSSQEENVEQENVEQENLSDNNNVITYDFSGQSAPPIEPQAEDSQSEIQQPREILPWRLRRKEVKNTPSQDTGAFTEETPISDAAIPDSAPEPTPDLTPRTSEPRKKSSFNFGSYFSSFWQQPTGLLLVVASTFISVVYNVVIKAIFFEKTQLFGSAEPLISPTLGNCLLILMLRMMVVVPIMLLLSPLMHSRVWQDVQNLAESVRKKSPNSNPANKRVLILSLVSGAFLFVSQILIYIAIAEVHTGVAVTLFFIYPVISGLLSWVLFRERLTVFRSGAIAAIGLGNLLVLFMSGAGTGNIMVGSTAAITAGIAFGFYVILTRICAAKMHPVTITLINFGTMLLLSFIGLMLPLPKDLNLRIDPTNLLEIILGAFFLGVLTLCGYVLNNGGIRKFGATRAAIVGATVPALTVIMAGLIIQETLQFLQVVGVLLVTLGAAAFSIEKMRSAANTPRNVAR